MFIVDKMWRGLLLEAVVVSGCKTQSTLCRLV